jgi:signal transduction histidine kinase
MRYLLLLAIGWLLALPAPATPPLPSPADTAVLRVTRLSPTDGPLPNGLLLASSWRYHPGDDPTWAQPSIDATTWSVFDPRQDLSTLPPDLRTGISWLRLRFRLADSLRLRGLQLQVAGYGAWEVYLNGQLVQRSGTVQPSPTHVPAPDQLPTIRLPAGGPAEQVLAVRFAPWQSPLLHLSAGNRGRPLLQVFLRDAVQERQLVARQLHAALVNCAACAIFGLLTLLHLAFFRYYPAQRANRYFAFFALAIALSSGAALLQGVLTYPPLSVSLLLAFMPTLLLAMAYLWAARALYVLFHFRSGWIYQVLWGSFWGLAVLSLSGVTYLGNLLALLVFLTNLELVRLTVRALRQRQRGAWVVGAGFGVIVLLLVVLVLAAVVSALVGVPNPLHALSNGNWAVSLLLVLAPALGISLFLAREFALDSQLLQVQLGEVERLSAQTLAQEQEKQALLAAQNELLEHQVAQRTGELQRSLADLRATQAQLIQKEKMASLGELTAGIAHEIQNPLNFVNNFAEVSAELLEELAEAQAAGDAEEAGALAADVRQNLGKITEHGRRAASIVRGMLEHARQRPGERAATDLNALCAEYLPRAYQDVQAKDTTFHATLHTDFALGLPLVRLASAEVGRVLLNLLGNAFYAVRQRQQTGEPGYQPQVAVTTEQVAGYACIRVSDNGPGMPAEVQAKIFQPFFTTKPTGEGTGLGLSLSHDIIAQGHGGTLRVESQPGQGTTFFVLLPLSNVAD